MTPVLGYSTQDLGFGLETMVRVTTLWDTVLNIFPLVKDLNYATQNYFHVGK